MDGWCANGGEQAGVRCNMRAINKGSGLSASALIRSLVEAIARGIFYEAVSSCGF